MLSFSVQSFTWKFLLICIHEQILIFKEILFSIYTSVSIFVIVLVKNSIAGTGR